MGTVTQTYEQPGIGGAIGAATTVASGGGGILTKIIILFVLGAIIMGVLLLGAQSVYTEYQRATGQLALRQAEAETEKLKTQAELERASADRAEAEAAKTAAEGERALDIATGKAIQAPAEAAARAVDRQSTVITFWGLISPGLLVSLMLVSSCLGGIGGPLGILLLYTFGKRYMPEFIGAWQKAKAEYDAKHQS